MHCIHCDRPCSATFTDDYGDPMCASCDALQRSVAAAFRAPPPVEAAAPGWVAVACGGCRMSWLAVRETATSRCPGCCGETEVPQPLPAGA